MPELRPWHLRLDRDYYQVSFTHGSRNRVRISTGTKDKKAAKAKAREIYASYVREHPLAERKGDPAPTTELGKLVERWLIEDKKIGETTAVVWVSYAGSWCDRWETLAELRDGVMSYRQHLLRTVQGKSARNNLGALRRFVTWCLERHILREPIDVPGIAMSELGVRHKAGPGRSGAPAKLTKKQVRAFLAALPEMSRSTRVAPFPVRAYFVVAYETGLRPSTLERLSAPEHYRKGAKLLHVTADVDKGKWERDLPLSPAARRELDKIVPKKGRIFGRHMYDLHVLEAAQRTLPREFADKMMPSAMRSSRVAHLAEAAKGNIAGLQYLTGIKDPVRLRKLVEPTLEGAQEVLEKAARG